MKIISLCFSLEPCDPMKISKRTESWMKKVFPSGYFLSRKTLEWAAEREKARKVTWWEIKTAIRLGYQQTKILREFFCFPERMTSLKVAVTGIVNTLRCLRKSLFFSVFPSRALDIMRIEKWKIDHFSYVIHDIESECFHLFIVFFYDFHNFRVFTTKFCLDLFRRQQHFMSSQCHKII